ncbi:hypothetical protein PHMEG_00036368 [Phytophthora megakarya]|uniref:Eukaryotic/viral aspartic protease n=1 Tax=Phytophthora megakarya TaxID=4795 RepID=A0A225UM16_9STRA|nr:hypothetical protein PHMEG_00036368 [Phytophthora megakarya]
MTPITERSVSFDDSVDYSDAKEDDEDDYLEEKTPVSELSEGVVVSVDRIAGVKALARNFAEELVEVAGPAMDSDDDGSDGTVWMNLEGELVVPIDSTSTRLVAQDTVMVLRAMGCEPQRFPSDAALDDWAPADAGTALRKWKKKLRLIPRKFHYLKPRSSRTISTGVFGSKGSPYMNDSHMVTPRSVSRQGRVVKENEASRPTPNTYEGLAHQPGRRYDLNEDSSDDGNDLLDVDSREGHLTEEWHDKFAN